LKKALKLKKKSFKFLYVASYSTLFFCRVYKLLTDCLSFLDNLKLFTLKELFKMSTQQQNTTEQQHLDDLVKLIKLAREDAENDGCNDHQVNFLFYILHANVL
jgi:hypothetical protein